MTRHAAALAGLLALAGTVAAVNPAAPPKPEPGRVAALIERLGSPVFAEREAATRELDAFGTAALGSLRKAAGESADLEVVRRAKSLVARLERRLANDAALAPTLVELNFDGKPLDAVLEGLSAQSGYAVLLGGDRADEIGPKPVTVKTGRVPFWEAVEAVCRAADLQVGGVGGVPAPGSTGAPAVRKPKGGDAGTAAPGADPKAVVKSDLERLKEERAAVLAKLREAAQAGNQADQAAALAELQKLAAEQAVARAKEAAKQAAAQPGPIGPAIVAARRPAVAAVAPVPTPAGYNPSRSVVLEPRRGNRRPAAVHGAVRVEAVGLPPHGGAADTVTAVLVVWPEPKLAWQQTRGVRVAAATDDRDQPLTPDLTASSGPATGTQVVQMANGVQVVQNVNGGVVIVNNVAPAQPPVAGKVGFHPSLRQAVVRLKPGAEPTAKLAELTGAVEGTVRSAPAALATVSDLTQPGDTASPAGVQVKTSPMKQLDGRGHTVEVELKYNQQEVQPASPDEKVAVAGPADPNAGVVVVNNGGGQVVIRQQVAVNGFPAAARRTTGTPFGLVVTDADGKRLAAAPISTQQRFANGEISTRVTLRVDQGTPAAVSFWGTRPVPVEVPFALKDVPATPAGSK